jgi:hypothetical protein
MTNQLLDHRMTECDMLCRFLLSKVEVKRFHCERAKVFQLVQEVLHIISNCQLIKERLLVNSSVVPVLCMAKEFQLIPEVLHIISNCQLIKEM